MKKTILLTIILTSGFLYGCSNSNPSSEQNADQPKVNNVQEVVQPESTPKIPNKESASTEAKQDITIQNFVFNPETINISIGTTVIWTNKDPMPHRIKSDSFNSSDLSTDQSFSFKFDKAGIYNYACGLHPSMKGQIIVK